MAQERHKGMILIGIRTVEFFWDNETKAICTRHCMEMVDPPFKAISSPRPEFYFDDRDEAVRWFMKQVKKGSS
jgi:hypothetical protein